MANLDKRLFNLLKKVYVEQNKGLQISNAVKIAFGKLYDGGSNVSLSYSETLCSRIIEAFPKIGIKPKSEVINFVFDEIKNKGFQGAGFDFSKTSCTGLSEDIKSKYFWIDIKTRPVLIAAPSPFNLFDRIKRKIDGIFEDTSEIKNHEKAFQIAAILFTYDEFYPVFKELVYKPWLVKDQTQKKRDQEEKQARRQSYFKLRSKFRDRETIRDQIKHDQNFYP